MIIDRLMLLNTFADSEHNDDFINAVDPKTKIPLHGMFPKKWLAEVRVRDLEIQNANVNGYFLIDDAFEGQSDFLTGLVIKNANLSYNSIQTLPEDMFQSLNGLKEVKLSHNLLETLPSNTWVRIPALLEKVDLRGNFLVCNCSMNWISRRLNKATKLIGQCIAPKSVEFQDIKPNLAAINNNCS
ncbi:uncharacterized protein TNIN_403651 [Trichonephila inaurata madagascariensis]|uniref:Uncharacterized protein n=1 Tax=Trichonephila inaurata madagascariensis TaxID=2747483 RepID=A0A8X6J990_9ARAC|nr:uncharacterized protein TNIN_403651 [Trichonephila inaurata madagascariensis]